MPPTPAEAFQIGKVDARRVVGRRVAAVGVQHAGGRVATQRFASGQQFGGSLVAFGAKPPAVLAARASICSKSTPATAATAPMTVELTATVYTKDDLVRPAAVGLLRCWPYSVSAGALEPVDTQAGRAGHAGWRGGARLCPYRPWSSRYMVR
jgi:hypothetical protein